MSRVTNAVCLLVLCAAWAPAGRAQQADQVPQGLSGSASFGLSLTQGNTDTLTLNVIDDSIYDPKTKNVVKWKSSSTRASAPSWKRTPALTRKAAALRHLARR